MTRRQGTIAAVGAIVGFMSRGAVAQEATKQNLWQSNGTAASIALEPMSMTFDLRTFKDFTFTEGDRTVTLTPAQLMDALLEK